MVKILTSIIVVAVLVVGGTLYMHAVDPIQQTSAAYWSRHHTSFYNAFKQKVVVATSTPVTATTTNPTPPVVATTTPPATNTPPVVAATTMQWGLYSDSSISSLESTLGKKIPILATFVGWGATGEFPTWYNSTVRDAGKTLLIYWELQDADYASINNPQYNYDSILSGSWDSYINSFAAAAKNYNGPIILVPFNEMNDNVSPWDGTVNGNSAAKHIAAYRKINQMFKDAGVTNVKFGWAPNSLSVPNTAANQLENYYPGGDVVDYVGVDGFNFANPWKSLSDIISPALKKLDAYNKPIFIFATASASGPLKPQWIIDGLSAANLNTLDPRIIGWIWFSQNKEQDWRINSNQATLDAFKLVTQ